MRYCIKLNRIVDGDTINADICLGFDFWFRDQNIRLAGVDTPEVRTSNPIEKQYGRRAAEFLEDWCKEGNLELVVDNEKNRDKFGRVFGELVKTTPTCEFSAAEDLIAAHLGVRYHGQTAEELKKIHLDNWERYFASDARI